MRLPTVPWGGRAGSPGARLSGTGCSLASPGRPQLRAEGTRWPHSHACPPISRAPLLMGHGSPSSEASLLPGAFFCRVSLFVCCVQQEEGPLRVAAQYLRGRNGDHRVAGAELWA